MAPAPRGLCSVLQGCRVRVTVFGSTRACEPQGMTVKWAWGTLNRDKGGQTPKPWLLFYKQSGSVTALTSVHTKFFVIPIEQYSPLCHHPALCYPSSPKKKRIDSNVLTLSFPERMNRWKEMNFLNGRSHAQLPSGDLEIQRNIDG